MRIGIYSPYFNTVGGGERYMLTIASCLQEKHRVDVFWNNELDIVKAVKKLSIPKFKLSIVSNVFAKKHNLFNKFITTRKYDLIIILSDGSIPKSFAKHNILHFQQPLINSKGRSFSNQNKLKDYKYIICNSQFTKKYIDREFKVNSIVMYPPVINNNVKPANKEKIILSVGRFHPYKKQKELIEAFIQSNLANLNWRFVLIGSLLKQDEEYFNTLAGLVNNSITLIPNSSYEILCSYYSKALLYWHGAGFGEDAVKNPERMEHFGIAPVEAMSYGCIPFVFNSGGLPEIVDNGENGFLWNTEEELITITQKVISNKVLTEKMRINAKLKAKEFSKEVFCEKINVLIKNIM